MSRPGGNPDIAKYGFKPSHGWAESCTERMTLKMPAAMKEAIKAGDIDNWQEIARRAIARELGWDIPE